MYNIPRMNPNPTPRGRKKSEPTPPDMETPAERRMIGGRWRDPEKAAKEPRADRVVAVSCCWFRGHEDKIVTKELESGYDETEVQP